MLSAVPPAFGVCQPCWGGGARRGLSLIRDRARTSQLGKALVTVGLVSFSQSPERKWSYPLFRSQPQAERAPRNNLGSHSPKTVRPKRQALGSLHCLFLIVRPAVCGIVAHTCNLQETKTGGSHDLGQPGLHGYLRP